MQELIQLAERQVNGEVVQTVNARDLHAFLEVGKVFAAWIQERIKQYDFLENQDFVCFPILESKGRGGSNRKDYHLTLDTAKELAMVERNAKGKQARQYFIECERLAKSKAAPNFLTDPAQLRAALLGYTEQVLALETTIKEQAPKVEFHDAVAEAINCQTVQQVAKVLGTGMKRLFAFLREERMLMGAGNMPYQRHVDAGHFRVVERTRRDDNGEVLTYTQTLVTGKGLQLIQKRMHQRKATLI